MLYHIMWLDLRKATFHAQSQIQYLEMPILIIWSVVSLEGKQMCLHEIRHDSIAIYSVSTYTPAVEWISSWIACHFR